MEPCSSEKLPVQECNTRKWVREICSVKSYSTIEPDRLFTGTFNSHDFEFSDSLGTHPLEEFLQCKSGTSVSETTTLKENLEKEPFFAVYDKVQEDIKKMNTDWKKLGKIHYISEKINSSSCTSDRWDDVTSIFSDSSKTCEFVYFQNHFKIDWKMFDDEKMQHIVWTKICSNHSTEEFVEMKKEDKKCRECGGTNINIEVRATVPLSMENVTLPLNESIKIYVANRITQLPSWKNRSYLSLEKMSEMYNFGKRVARERASEEEKEKYNEWVSQIKRFVKSQFYGKNYSLEHGRIIRRKVTTNNEIILRRAFIFADIFLLC